MAKEYIEREAAYEKCGWYNIVNGKSVCAVRKDELAAIPAADVVEVVHGRWVAKPTMYRHPNARNYYCSECRYEPTETKEFCPLCGARMDGGD